MMMMMTMMMIMAVVVRVRIEDLWLSVDAVVGPSCAVLPRFYYIEISTVQWLFWLYLSKKDKEPRNQVSSLYKICRRMAIKYSHR